MKEIRKVTDSTVPQNTVYFVQTDNSKFPRVYNGDDPEQRYEFGYELGRLGHKLKPEEEAYPEIVMGWEDAQGDDYLSVVHPPKPPLDLSKNPKIKDEEHFRSYAEDSELLTKKYKVGWDRRGFRKGLKKSRA